MSDDRDAPRPEVFGGYIDIPKWQAILEGEMRRQEECRAGTRGWKYNPGEHPHYPQGLAGMTPEETERLERFSATMDRVEAEWRDRRRDITSRGPTP